MPGGLVAGTALVSPDPEVSYPPILLGLAANGNYVFRLDGLIPIIPNGIMIAQVHFRRK